MWTCKAQSTLASTSPKHLELVLPFLPETVQCILHREIVQLLSPANRSAALALFLLGCCSSRYLQKLAIPKSTSCVRAFLQRPSFQQKHFCFVISGNVGTIFPATRIPTPASNLLPFLLDKLFYFGCDLPNHVERPSLGPSCKLELGSYQFAWSI